LLIIGGVSSSGSSRTFGVCGLYWMSSNTGQRSTTAPGVTAMSSPIVNADVSTIEGIRGGVRMSRAKLPAPRTKLRPPVSSAALSTAGLVMGALDGASASSTFSAAKRTWRSLRQSSPASQISPSTAWPAAR
jgi:hypothetical protein